MELWVELQVELQIELQVDFFISEQGMYFDKNITKIFQVFKLFIQ